MLGPELTHDPLTMRKLPLTRIGPLHIDAMQLDKVGHMRHRVTLGIEELPGRCVAIELDHRRVGKLGRTDAAEPGIAARCPPAGISSIQHHHLETMGCRKPVRSMKPAISGTNDCDFRANGVFQWQQRFFRRWKRSFPVAVHRPHEIVS